MHNEQIAPAAEDVMVLAQVTQPLREHGLLDSVARVIRDGHRSCITVTERPANEWRAVQGEGSWGTKDAPKRWMMDGKLYAWRPGCAADIFDSQAPHGC